MPHPLPRRRRYHHHITVTTTISHRCLREPSDSLPFNRYPSLPPPAPSPSPASVLPSFSPSRIPPATTGAAGRYRCHRYSTPRFLLLHLRTWPFFIRARVGSSPCFMNARARMRAYVIRRCARGNREGVKGRTGYSDYAPRCTFRRA